MSPFAWEIIAATAFVGSHFILSHPLRAPIVARVGERGFLGLYSLVAAVTLVWLVLAYRATAADAPLWAVGDGLWAIGTVLMLVGSILFVGSLIGNPALPDPSGRPKPAPVPRGVFTITRHPMMWGFAIWGIVHILIFPTPANIVLCKAIIILALVGAWLQDRKKARLQPDTWPQWQAQTSYWPFAGRARIGGFRGHDIAGGVVVWLAATWAHIPLAAWAAGIWRWIV
ncbi:NnrU family protein [Sphingomonas donggukensis]|uniref:NnrU family protein n=1 Tax=Sphingomonas donggukensis TaxID=2949093 RepID=A0ABY4TTT6_9SPHN|nr:NnrU family protein [Sphingomonas donggukensis]URW75824.1 NnrU family protein [Sphingomonas donggukensis]